MTFETSTIVIWVSIYIAVFTFFIYDVIRINFINKRSKKMPEIGEFILTTVIASLSSTVSTIFITEVAKHMGITSLIYLSYVLGFILFTFGLTVLIYLTVKFLQMSGVEDK